MTTWQKPCRSRKHYEYRNVTGLYKLGQTAWLRTCSTLMPSVTQTIRASVPQTGKRMGGCGVSPNQCAGSILDLNCFNGNPITSSDHLTDALLFKHQEGATKSVRFSWIPTSCVFSVNTGLNRLLIEISVCCFLFEAEDARLITCRVLNISWHCYVFLCYTPWTSLLQNVWNSDGTTRSCLSECSPRVCQGFFTEYIPLFSVCRDEKAQLADIFLKKGPYLKMYSTYIREFDKNVALLEEQSKKNTAFGAVVREFEVMQLAQPVFSVHKEGGVAFAAAEVPLFIYDSRLLLLSDFTAPCAQASPLCANLALKHYLLKPVQRIPQYQLLLTGTSTEKETKHLISRPVWGSPIQPGCICSSGPIQTQCRPLVPQNKNPETTSELLRL